MLVLNFHLILFDINKILHINKIIIYISIIFLLFIVLSLRKLSEKKEGCERCGLARIEEFGRFLSNLQK